MVRPRTEALLAASQLLWQHMHMVEIGATTAVTAFRQVTSAGTQENTTPGHILLSAVVPRGVHVLLHLLPACQVTCCHACMEKSLLPRACASPDMFMA
jgi:hypothetical protein